MPKQISFSSAPTMWGDGRSKQPAPLLDRLVGTTLGGSYFVRSKIAEGGMGSIYLAEVMPIQDDPRKKKKVAVKTINDRPDIDQLRMKFLQESALTLSIKHDNIVEAIGSGETPDGRPFLVLEYLKGENLSDLLADGGPMKWGEVKNIALQICAALAEVHARKLIHRDVKPSNIMVDKNAPAIKPKLVDFGLAKTQGTITEEPGTLPGSLQYIAPEQIRSQDHDHRSDLYSFGVTLYQLVSGRLPFYGSNQLDTIRQHLEAKPPALKERNPNADATPAMEAVIMRALRKNPEERFNTAMEMAASIDSA